MSEKKTRQKIILFIDSLEGGGAQRQIVELACNLDRNIFEPIVVIYHNRQHYRPDLDKCSVPVVLIRKRGKLDPFFFMKLMSFFKHEKPQVIQSYLNVPNFWARVAGKIAGVRCIVTSERNMDILNFKVRVILERIFHRFSTRIVVNAEAIRKILTDDIGIPNEKIVTIYNGVDCDRFNCSDQRAAAKFKLKHNIQDSDFVITLPGRLAPQKNHMCLIKAMQEAKSNLPAWKLLFVGNEYDSLFKKQIANYAHKRDILKNLVFAGRQRNMALIYGMSDVVVLPSLWEGFPNVLLEAMAAGRPVVASEIADNAKIVTNGYNGYLFKCNDHIALARILTDMAARPKDDIERMGLNGKLFVTSAFSIKNMIVKYQELYLSLIS